MFRITIRAGLDHLYSLFPPPLAPRVRGVWGAVSLALRSRGVWGAVSLALRSRGVWGGCSLFPSFHNYLEQF
ncbi:hypothetical protein PLAN_40990 [Planktothrix rubescens CCAP 1459/22]|uniref:Uncharacterized protein n=1 Tax=Planktothrix rubescens CCAP 1459/22 TaxID=329571 RepID=A0A6J7ZNY1_PLARU|nr:hypothetical protein PLAN_40990 [Planktothrix rubescens NIVA-CYA 18]